jgi:single-strand DNA-binding protein
MYQKYVAIGHLGQEPTCKYTPSGTTVANFSIAIDESYKDKSGNKVSKTEWVNIVAWEKLAELANEYLKKGSLVLIEGKLQTRSWSDQSTGEKKYKTECVASTIKFLDKKESKPETEEPF